MTGFAYLGALLVSTAAMALIDARWRLAFWRSPVASALAVGAGTAVLLGWDLVGIGFGVFLRGDSPWATGIVLAPELPLEEPVFLAFLSYLSLVAVLGVDRLLARREQGHRDDDDGTDRATEGAGSSRATVPTADAADEPGGRAR